MDRNVARWYAGSSADARGRVGIRGLLVGAVVTALLVAFPAQGPRPAVAAGAAGDAACPDEVGSATSFSDVPAGNVHRAAIGCLTRWGISQGRGDGTYGPRTTVTRAQLATFVARAITHSGGELPESPTDAFTDDDRSVHEPAVNKLSAVGIVSGISEGRFRPDGLVTRQQLASILVKAFEYRSKTTLGSDGDRFDDDNGSAHEDNINRAAAAGFASGTEKGFEPYAHVRRDEMASFLARVLTRLVEDGHTEPLVGSPRSATVEARAGTVILRPDQVLDIDTLSGLGGRVTLNGPDPRLSVGGHVAVPRTAYKAAGDFGRVLSISPQSDGSVELELAPAALPDGLEQLELTYDGPVSANIVNTKTGKVVSQGTTLDLPTIQSGALECDGPRLDNPYVKIRLENLRTLAHINARNRFVLFQLSGEMVVQAHFDKELPLLRCNIAPWWASTHQLQLVLPTVGGVPVVLEAAPLLEFEIVAGLEVNVGVRIWFTRGFQYDRGDFRLVSGGSAVAENELSAYVEGSLFMGGDFAVKAWDVAGIFLKLGPEVSLRATPDACVTLSVTGRADLGARLDVWIARADRKFVTVEMFRSELARRCFGRDEVPPADDAADPPGGSLPPGQPDSGSAPAPETAAISLSRGSPAPDGYWYSVSLSGFRPRTAVTVTCRDSLDPQGFWNQTVTTDSSGSATDTTLCYSADGPDHWVTASGVESNHATWSGDAPVTDTPGVATITLTQGGAAPLGYWYSVSLTGFSANSAVTVACHDSVDSNFYSQTLTTNGSGSATDTTLCYSADGPDHWVTASGVESNHVTW